MNTNNVISIKRSGGICTYDVFHYSPLDWQQRVDIDPLHRRDDVTTKSCNLRVQLGRNKMSLVLTTKLDYFHYLEKIRIKYGTHTKGLPIVETMLIKQNLTGIWLAMQLHI